MYFVLLSFLSAKTYELTTFSDNPFSVLASKIVEAAYIEAGLKVKFLYVPGRRAIKMSSTGESDGEVLRIEGIEKTYPSLIPVKVNFLTLVGSAYWMKDDVRISTVEDLKKYKIAAIRGVVFSDRLTDKDKTSYVSGVEQMLKLLVTGRVDAIFGSKGETDAMVKTQYGNIHNKIKQKDLVMIPVFHYVHVKNKLLVKKLEKAFLSIKNKGIVDSIIKKFEKSPL